MKHHHFYMIITTLYTIYSCVKSIILALSISRLTGSHCSLLEEAEVPGCLRSPETEDDPWKMAGSGEKIMTIDFRGFLPSFWDKLNQTIDGTVMVWKNGWGAFLSI